MILFLHKLTNSKLNSFRSKVESGHFICYCNTITTINKLVVATTTTQSAIVVGSQHTVRTSSLTASLLHGKGIKQFNCDDDTWIGLEVVNSLAQECGKLVNGLIA